MSGERISNGTSGPHREMWSNPEFGLILLQPKVKLLENHRRYTGILSICMCVMVGGSLAQANGRSGYSANYKNVLSCGTSLGSLHKFLITLPW